jgi:predicted ester cyclase
VANMVMTILEAHVAPEQWSALDQAYQQAKGDLPSQMVATFLVHSVAEPMLWRGISVWHSREALDEYRRSTKVPGGVQMFRAVGAEPALSLFNVVAQRGAVNDGDRRSPGTPQAGTTRSAEGNKALVRRQFVELWAGNLAVADEIFAANHVDHDPNYPVHDPESWKRLVSTQRAAFPDLHFTVEDMIAAGDKVVTRWTWRGTLQDTHRGGQAAAKEMTMTGITIDRIADGKIVESWANADNLDLVRELGPASPIGPPGT